MAASVRTTPDVDACLRSDEALTRAFQILGKRWNALVLGSLQTGPAGFRELSRAIDGVSDSVLADRLAELTQHDLVRRRVDEGPPVSVSYALTERGEALMPALGAISAWAVQHLPSEAAEGAEVSAG
ncbi:winged helix-turn-helix transcriptional regulator [Jiangella mangrovi]|uniref:DNA-binding HxlR family transcriptional regulator n=1 Tax=Jiangella mangrovi TaxID=1524084 RepID=A0A7W9GR15_9ACTN|nr:helix-turn-helix domain-containing protein [Jiangella mangrovi]MBB5788166.1 DNA-binding HxlR family transcriptional regulator [Jiangella mangrovi]